MKRQKDFWKLLDKFSTKKTSISSNAPHDALSRHIKSLLNSKSHVDLPPDSNERGQLDYIITLNVLKKASGIIKPGKDFLSTREPSPSHLKTIQFHARPQGNNAGVVGRNNHT